MRIYSAKDDAPLGDRRPAVTVGVFDGVHLGHRAIIDELVAAARGLGVPSLAITFNPHPRLALGRSAPPAITDLDNRLRLLAAAGLDAAWVLTLTPEMAALPGRDFAEEFFHRRLGASAAVLGEGARFGRGRDGDPARLAAWAESWGMPVRAAPSLVIDGEAVSSTAIRLATQGGDLDRAALMLGRPVSVTGTVVHGQGLAASFGFPTLNLDPHHELKPPAGVYATISWVNGLPHPSVTNVGRPPTRLEIAAGIKDFLVEAHLLDFDGDLYDRVAEVFFVKKIRDIKRFGNSGDLVRQVRLDMEEARDYFARNPVAAGSPPPATLSREGNA